MLALGRGRWTVSEKRIIRFLLSVHLWDIIRPLSRVCNKRENSAERYNFSHLYELFSIPCFLTQHFFSKSLLEAEKQNGNLLLTIDTIDARNIIIMYLYLGRTDRRGQKGKMLNPQIAILTVRNQFHFHYCALPIMHLLYPFPHPPPPKK